MKKFTYIISLLFVLPFIFVGCGEDNYTFGDIVAPSNIEITYEIVGKDTNNPYGDGSGTVNFTITGNNAITYRMDFGDGKSKVSPSGEFSYNYTKTGVNTFTAVAIGVGTAGVLTSVPVEITIYSSFSDEEAETLLAGNTVGGSKTWYWAADVSGYAGLGPVEDDYGNGDFAYAAWWNASAWDATRTCMFENTFVFTKTDDGVTYHQTADDVFVPGAYASALGVDGDQCYGTSVISSVTGEKQVSIFASTSKAALEGTYNGNAYRRTSFELSDNGMLGWWVGSSTYDIISITETTLIVRVMQPNSVFAWYHIFTTVKPEEEPSFDTLVWSDEFDTDGAPNSSNWTYDLGAGGWGNGELQTYTSNSENVIVEGGVLKITAKANGSGGYTSARLKSQGLQSFKYGRVEVSAKLPSSQGTWPAIWMLGDSFSTLGWPACGEIDIMEQTGNDKASVLGTLHWLDSSSANASYGETTAVSNTSSEFHTYALEWTEDALKIYVDGVQHFEMANSANLPFNDNFFMLLNVAMGGTLGGTVDAAFTEDTMEIDYVRVYQ